MQSAACTLKNDQAANQVVCYMIMMHVHICVCLCRFSGTVPASTSEQHSLRGRAILYGVCGLSCTPKLYLPCELHHVPDISQWARPASTHTGQSVLVRAWWDTVSMRQWTYWCVCWLHLLIACCADSTQWVNKHLWKWLSLCFIHLAQQSFFAHCLLYICTCTCAYTEF